ncbi:hypothetical protein AB0B45_23130 [Nonomuraea sp. NPDC049152]|uniref:hypothetical protein n=1 Tax=Nonomuraea sp. NPDC049152 TaxID=3154350 RepID=UPI0033D06983
MDISETDRFRDIAEEGWTLHPLQLARRAEKSSSRAPSRPSQCEPEEGEALDDGERGGDGRLGRFPADLDLFRGDSSRIAVGSVTSLTALFP